MVIFDSVDQLVAVTDNLPDTLSDIGGPRTRLVLTCHDGNDDYNELSQGYYVPKPIQILEYMATTVMRVFPLSQVLARKIANNHSKAEPSFGIDANVEGIVVGTGANSKKGLVAEIEYRRMSGRAVRLAFILNPSSDLSKPSDLILSQEHPDLVTISDDLTIDNGGHHESTFELGLTQEQRSARDSVILPYFDAQTGSGDGGKILYDMDREDDFDEEEDEI